MQQKQHPACKDHPTAELRDDGSCHWCDPRGGFCGGGPLGEFLDSLSPASRGFVERMAKIAADRVSRRRGG